MTIPIIVDTSPQSDVILLELAAQANFPSVKEVHVTPTVRLGNSGSRVYRAKARTDDRGWSRYYYSKVGKSAKLRREYDAYLTHVRDEIPIFSRAWFVQYRGEACLCCFVAGSNPNNEPNPLVELLSHPITAPLSKICDAIERVYAALLAAWRSASRPGEINWVDAYKYYLRWERAEPFVKSWLGEAECAKKTTGVNGRKLASPFRMIEQISSDAWKAPVNLRPVHGDLHQRNIIMDKVGEEFNPWLIDFGWTREFHALVDYALLEASLKIFHFGKFFSEERYLKLHDLLHQSTSDSLKHYGPEEAMLGLVRTIRRMAKQEVHNRGAWPREYYLASLIVSMGLLPIQTSLIRMTWLTSAWFASHLDA